MNQVKQTEKDNLEAEFETLRPMWLAAEDAVKQATATLRLAERTERMMRQRMDDIIIKLDAMDAAYSNPREQVVDQLLAGTSFTIED